MDEPRQKAHDEIFCSACGKIVKAEAEICPNCGVRVRSRLTREKTSDKSRLAAFLLAFFLGFFGVHRFYVGKTGSGVAMIFLAWLTLGIWPLVDWILILTGNFTDAEGKKILDWGS